MQLVDRVTVSAEPLRIVHYTFGFRFNSLRSWVAAIFAGLTLLMVAMMVSKARNPEQPTTLSLSCDHTLERCLASTEGGKPIEVGLKGAHVISKFHHSRNSPSYWDLSIEGGHGALGVNYYTPGSNPYSGAKAKLESFLADPSAPPLQLELVDLPASIQSTFAYGGMYGVMSLMMALAFLIQRIDHTVRPEGQDIATPKRSGLQRVARWKDILAVRVDERRKGRFSVILERQKGADLKLIWDSTQRDEALSAAEAVAHALGVAVRAPTSLPRRQALSA